MLLTFQREKGVILHLVTRKVFCQWTKSSLRDVLEHVRNWLHSSMISLVGIQYRPQIPEQGLENLEMDSVDSSLNVK